MIFLCSGRHISAQEKSNFLAYHKNWASFQFMKKQEPISAICCWTIISTQKKLSIILIQEICVIQRCYRTYAKMERSLPCQILVIFACFLHWASHLHMHSSVIATWSCFSKIKCDNFPLTAKKIQWPKKFDFTLFNCRPLSKGRFSSVVAFFCLYLISILLWCSNVSSNITPEILLPYTP